jgi:hypothetical protein
MKKTLINAVSVLVLTGCASPAPVAPQPTDIATQEAEPKNQFERGCDEFRAGTISHKYLDVYTPILEDICRDFDLNYDLVEVITSEKVDPESVARYVDANVFGLSYWNRYVEEGMPQTKLVLLMEEEQDWWEQQLGELLEIEPVWFGPSAEAGHCYAAEAEAFCPKLYVGNEGDTKGDYNVLTTMLGSRMQWTTFRQVVAIHESTHSFQTAVMLGHWRYWFVEGQATYFELAASVLVPDLRGSNWRDDQLRQAHGQDKHRFKAKTVEEAYRYMQECDSGYECDGFRYVGASFAHQLLVDEFGMDKYIEWNLAIARDLPDFNWRTMHKTPDIAQKGRTMFEESFQEHFGIDINTWEKTVFAPYVLEHYKLPS